MVEGDESSRRFWSATGPLLQALHYVFAFIFTKIGGGSHCWNFDKLHDIAPLSC